MAEHCDDAYRRPKSNHDCMDCIAKYLIIVTYPAPLDGQALKCFETALCVRAYVCVRTGMLVSKIKL